MKRSAVQDAWRHLCRGNRPLSIERLKLVDKAPLADVELTLPPGLTVLCGRNGSGKSSLLGLIFTVLGGDLEKVPLIRSDLIQQGVIEIDVNDGGDVRSFPAAIELGAQSIMLLDPFLAVARLRREIDQENFNDLLEGVDAHEFDVDEIEVARYVVGRRYNAVRVWEAEDTSGAGDEVVPIFEVDVGDRSYRSDHMGLGELACLSMIWTLWQAPPRCVLAVDEPETFLASSSATAFMNTVADVAVDRGHYVVVATHAIEILESVPLDNVRLLRLGIEGIELAVCGSRGELERHLQSPVGASRVVLVEDKMASMMLQELLGRSGGLWAGAAEIQVADGVANIRNICERFPRTDGVSLVGVLDGDQAEVEGTAWPIVVLPGGDSPDRVLRVAAESQLEQFGNACGRDANAVRSAFDGVGGVEDHDWAAQLSDFLGLHEAVVVRAAVECWQADADVAEETAGFVDRLLDALEQRA